MTTDKENIVFYIGILTLLLMIVCSMLVKFNMYDALYVLFMITVIIRFILISRED